ncbi:MAG: transporter [Verrucomicrobiota bacterium]
MKAKTLLAMALCATIGLAANPTVFAQEHKEHKEGEKAKIPETVDGILKEIHKHHDELAATVKAKKLADVHHHAFAIRDLAKALPAKAHPDHKKMVENAVKKVSQLAEDLDKSGDAGDQAKTEANLKKMDAALKTLEEHAKM